MTLPLRVALFLAALLLPLGAQALSLAELRSATVLVLYGAIGFFGAVSLAFFLGGFGIYMARLGTEHRVEGIYRMIQGTEMFFVVVCITFALTYFFE